jgi:hypothetical protein
MPTMILRMALAAACCVLVAAVPAAALTPARPTLVARALLPSGATWPAPFPAAPNAEPVDVPGSQQPVGGFSALLRAPGAGNFFAMPDNGFGTKANSRSFDLRARRYTSVWRTYRVADASLLVSDFAVLDGDRFVALERDSSQGISAVHKRAFVVDLDETAADGTVAKREVANLLDLGDPHEISLPARPGDIGLGNQFSMPYVTIESILPVRRGRDLMIVNDTNFGSTGRNPALPDDSDFIVIRVPGPNNG